MSGGTTTPEMKHDGKTEQQWREQAEEQDPGVLALAASYVPGSEEERKLVRKLDIRIVPCIWALYTLSYLDRANIGNAKTGGLQADFNLTSNQYSVVLLVFFISYVLFQVPSNYLLTRVRPSLYLSGLCVIWGGIAACMAATHNWSQIAAVRFILGIVEAGFAPGVTFYLSSWYRKYELSSRYSIYYTATAVSGAFSGLLAGLITQYLDGARGLRGWQWLFIIEGVGSSGLGFITWFFMPDWPSTTKWLTDEERLLCAQRLAYDGLANTGVQTMGPWTAFKLVVTDWRVGMLTIMYMLATGAQTIQYFVPTLISNLGWTGYDAQYHTIPLYASAFVFILTFCFASDYKKNKPFFVILGSIIGTICFIIVVAVPNSHVVQYVFLIFGFGSVYAVCPLVGTWVPNVISQPAEKRAMAIALVNGLGNSASIYGVFLWPSNNAPRYIPGWSATTVFMALLGILTVVLSFLLKRYPDPQTIAPSEIVTSEIEKQRQRGAGEEV